MTNYLGENIRRLRKEKNLTQEALASMLGVTYQSISKWERCESCPDISLLPAISSFFDISCDELLGVDKFRKEEKIKKLKKLFTNVFPFDILNDTPFKIKEQYEKR